jgi:thimet oligopeptidase
MTGAHLHTGFTHLAEYNCAYYTYGWSLVIAKDLFAAFDSHDLLNPEIGKRYCDAILAPGGSRDATELIEDFLGRPHSFEPFRRWLSGTGTPDAVES